MAIFDRVQSGFAAQGGFTGCVAQAHQVTSDPLFGAVTTILSVPMVQIYAVMLRAGIISTS